jgi:hypothetical protein
LSGYEDVIQQAAPKPHLETACPDCNRHVMAVPQSATGFIAACGRRLTRLSECGAPEGCRRGLDGESVLPEPRA